MAALRRTRTEISNEHGITGCSLNASLTLSIIDRFRASLRTSRFDCAVGMFEDHFAYAYALVTDHTPQHRRCVRGCPRGSPLKQAIGAEVTLVKPGGRILRPA